ncbi:MAG: hypothetical protein ABC505_05500 [Candidatus Methanosuratincola petrocarbonis]
MIPTENGWDGQQRISPELCDGCSVCSRVCAFGSIRRAETEGERR